MSNQELFQSAIVAFEDAAKAFRERGFEDSANRLEAQASRWKESPATCAGAERAARQAYLAYTDAAYSHADHLAYKAREARIAAQELAVAIEDTDGNGLEQQQSQEPNA